MAKRHWLDYPLFADVHAVIFSSARLCRDSPIRNSAMAGIGGNKHAAAVYIYLCIRHDEDFIFPWYLLDQMSVVGKLVRQIR